MGGDQTVFNFLMNNIFSSMIVRFKGGWLLYLEDGYMSWDLNVFCLNAVKLLFHGFFRLTPPYLAGGVQVCTT